MKTQWVIQCVGTSEEDQAHLRLLLRSARKQLSDDWAWGSESEADLLIMDRQGPIEDAANLRASQAGVASARLIEAGEPAPEGLFLQKPLHKDAFAALLNAVARGAASEPETVEAAPLEEAPSAAETDTKADAAATAAPVTPAAGPAGDEPSAAARSGNDAQPSPKAAEPGVDENAMRSLLFYLPKRVLGGPAQIVLPDAPLLIIDPDSRMFWAEGPLPVLEPYVREQLRFGDWKRMEKEELELARKGSEARPYAYLTWLDTFIHSKGALSRRLDPNGTYGLSKRLDLANDYPHALRISAQMTRPRTLDQIARASGVDLAEVFDVVNAYEAIGYLEWTRSGAAPPRKA